MSNQQQFEDNIKKVLYSKAENIAPSDDMFQKIKSEIKTNRSEKIMHFKLKKSMIAASCCFIIAGSVLATSPNFRASALQSIGKYVNGYTDMKHYDSAPSKTQLQKDMGYSVKLPDSLPGGYKLIDADIDGHIDGSNPDKQYDNRGAGATYSINNNRKQSITLTAQKRDTEANAAIFKNAKAVKIGDNTAYFTEYTVHDLPVGTKLSKEQQKKENEDIKNGKEVLVGISSSKNNTSKESANLKEKFTISHSLKWKDNGINYQLTDSNDKLLSMDQMVKIAEYVMNTK